MGSLLQKQACIGLVLIKCFELVRIAHKHTEIIVARVWSDIKHETIDTGVELNVSVSSMLISSTVDIPCIAQGSTSPLVLESLKLGVTKAELHHRETTILLV